MRVSQLGMTIVESPTLALNEEAARLKARGDPVIHLGGGEPKNPAPMNAILAAASKLNTGDVKYAPTEGTGSLKQAVIRYTEENYGRLVSADNVIVSTGAKQALFNALLSIVSPQEEVIILAPYWVSYPEMVKMTYGIPIIVHPEDGTFVPRFKEIEEVVSSYTRAIIVNSPNNPSGAVFPEDLIAQLVDFCERRDIYLIMDDIYQKLVFDGVRTPSAYTYTQKDTDSSHVIIVNGISKLYGMTGFRIGWAIAAAELVEVMANMQVQTTSCAALVSQAAAEGALNGVQSNVESLRMTIQNNRDVMLEELQSIEGLRITKPHGTFYCLPDFRAFGSSSLEIATQILKKALVVTVPGEPFGAEGHLRLSYCGPTKDIKEGVKRIKWVLDPSSPNEIYIGDRKLVRDWL